MSNVRNGGFKIILGETLKTSKGARIAQSKTRNMKNYHVYFYYETDLRTDAEVVAKNEVAALSAALKKIHEKTWIDCAAMRIEIKTY